MGDEEGGGACAVIRVQVGRFATPSYTWAKTDPMAARRGDELLALMRKTIATDVTPLEQLHEIIDATEAFHAARP